TAQIAAPFVTQTPVVMDCKLDKIFYGNFMAVRDSHVPIEKTRSPASSVLPAAVKAPCCVALNRMNDLVKGFRFEGHVHFLGQDVYGKGVDPVVVRRYIGMVFQQPNPFSMSIFDNVAFGLRLNRYKGDLGDRVKHALQGAALWDEVKDKLKVSGLSLSGGQQQRLCIARAIATEPEVLLLDEPCSALDPIATRRVEELMVELKKDYTIALVTHNMQQAIRVADTTAFFSVDISQGTRTGYLVEMGPTTQIFGSPREQMTEDYISGKFS
ncbi:phosphate ABC transporter ATP-binding protein, partial [Pseudomonas sp. TH10]|uniref:phosphate ABC transporter ATP-binding protein n=1 Tax=Pseudomonas sp. TH10 TaxID=2796376 RepID=UPI0035A84942